MMDLMDLKGRLRIDRYEFKHRLYLHPANPAIKELYRLATEQLIEELIIHHPITWPQIILNVIDTAVDWQPHSPTDLIQVQHDLVREMEDYADHAVRPFRNYVAQPIDKNQHVRRWECDRAIAELGQLMGWRRPLLWSWTISYIWRKAYFNATLESTSGDYDAHYRDATLTLIQAFRDWKTPRAGDAN